MWAKLTVNVHSYQDESPLEVTVSPLEATLVILSRQGFYDLDIEPGVGNVRITASGLKGAKVTATGRNIPEACENILEKVL